VREVLKVCFVVVSIRTPGYKKDSYTIPYLYKLFITSLKSVATQFFEGEEQSPAKGRIKGYITCQKIRTLYLGRSVFGHFITFPTNSDSLLKRGLSKFTAARHELD